jgi:hypothetical protein
MERLLENSKDAIEHRRGYKYYGRTHEEIFTEIVQSIDSTGSL